MRVAFQGERGAYSEEAVLKRYGGSAEPVPRRSLRHVFDSVERGEVEFGLVPVENTIEGGIGETLDLLLERSLSVQGEEILRVVHCLVAIPGVPMSGVRRVYSHPQALGQCRAFLERHGLDPISFYDTAGSVKMIGERGLRDAAAIAGCRAAEVYGMAVLARGIETRAENYTRFLVVGRGGSSPTGLDRTSLAFSVEHVPGSLVGALRVFADRGVSVSRLESRPLAGRPWEYVFFVDVLGHVGDGAVGGAVRELEGCSRWVRVLGSYPRAGG